MVRKIKNIQLIICISLFVFSLAACRHSVYSENQEKTITVSGKILTEGVIDEEDSPESTSRTAVPDLSSYSKYYKIIAEKTGADPVEFYSGTAAYTIPLSIGQWELSAYVYESESQAGCIEGNLLFEPKENISITITAEDPDIADLKLCTKIADGKGSNQVKLPIELGQNDLADKAIVKMNGETKEIDLTVSSPEILLEGISSGSHELTITFYKNNKIVFVCTQWVNVVNGHTTENWVEDTNCPYLKTGSFILTAACILYQKMTEFYVDSSVSSSTEMGTPANPFKSVSDAFGVIESCAANEGIQLFIKSGTSYNITDTISLTKSLSVNTYGGTEKATLVHKVETDKRLLNLNYSGKQIVSFENIVFDGDSNIASSYNINIANSDETSQVTFTKCKFINGGTAISSKGFIYIKGVVPVNFVDCVFEDNDDSNSCIYAESVAAKSVTVTLSGGEIKSSNMAVFLSTNANLVLENNVSISQCSFVPIHTVETGNKVELKSGELVFTGASGAVNLPYKLIMTGGVLDIGSGYLKILDSKVLQLLGGTVKTTSEYAVYENGNGLYLGGDILFQTGSYGVYVVNGKIVKIAQPVTNEITFNFGSYEEGLNVFSNYPSTSSYIAECNTKLKPLKPAWIINSEGKLVKNSSYINEFYVGGSSADDANDGNSEAAAYKTFKKAFSRLEDGDMAYTINICGDMDETTLASGESAVINIASLYDFKTLTIQSSDSTVVRTISAGKQSSKNPFYIPYLGGTGKTVNVNKLKFTDSLSYGVYIDKSATTASTNKYVFTDCIFGDESKTEYPTDVNYGNKSCGIYSYQYLELNQCKIFYNYGGAIKAAGDLIIKDCEIEYNYNYNTYFLKDISGIIRSDAASSNIFKIENSVIKNNKAKTAENASGGAVKIINSPAVTISGGTIIKDNYNQDSSTPPVETVCNFAYSFTAEKKIAVEEFSGAQIGISDIRATKSYPISITSGFSEKNPGVNPDTVFFADNSSLVIQGTDEAELNVNMAALSDAVSLTLCEGSKDVTDNYVYGDASVISFAADTRTYSPELYADNPYILSLEINDSQTVKVKVNKKVVSYNTETKVQSSSPDETVELTSETPVVSGSNIQYSYNNVKLYEVENSGSNLETRRTIESINVYIDGHSTPDYTITPDFAAVYYVGGSDAVLLKAPDGSLSLSGSLEYPYTSVQKAVDAIGSRTASIYVEGTVIDTPRASNSESGSDIQITEGGTISILSYKQINNTATAAVLKNITTDARVLAIWNNSTVTIGPGVTITGGNVTTSDCGGGIVNGATLILDGCTVTGNSVGELIANSTAMGGGIYCNQESTTTIKDGTVISNNKAGKFGGGITVCGGELILNGGTFTDNTVIASDGAGKDIQIKVYEEWSGGNKTEVRKNPSFTIEKNTSSTINILLGYNDLPSEPAKIILKVNPSHKYNIELDSNIRDGEQLIIKGVSLNTGWNEKFIILKDGAESSTLYIDSDGKLREKTTSGNIDIGNKTVIDNIGELGDFYFPKSDAGKNTITITLSNDAGAAIFAKDSGHEISFRLYNPESATPDDPVSSGTGTVVYDNTNNKYTAPILINNHTSLEIGEYQLYVTTESNDPDKVIEGKFFTVWVVY